MTYNAKCKVNLQINGGVIEIDIANRIKEYREKKRLTQQELADRLGINRVTITQWETGKSNPRPVIFPKLIKALGLKKIDQIFLLEKVK